MKHYSEHLDLSPEVALALKNNQPIVALESTIISHGMPYPQNVETALRVEQIISDGGCVAATIGIIKGRLKAGLSRSEIEYLGQAPSVVKASRRDLPFIVANKLDGATTVAATMIIAEMAGIKVFVTGGIGGVHRGAQETMDISADLTELAKTNVAVVCAGCKSILDIGLTLEYLETHGVPVLGYQTSDFPAFYTRKSGFPVDFSAQSAAEIAEALRVKWALGLSGGVVVANPIPAEHELDPTMIDKIIADAIAEAAAHQVRGKEITPFLLDKIKAMTDGASLAANIELVYNNARLGAKIARATTGTVLLGEPI